MSFSLSAEIHIERKLVAQVIQYFFGQKAFVADYDLRKQNLHLGIVANESNVRESASGGCHVLQQTRLVFVLLFHSATVACEPQSHSGFVNIHPQNDFAVFLCFVPQNIPHLPTSEHLVRTPPGGHKMGKHGTLLGGGIWAPFL